MNWSKRAAAAAAGGVLAAVLGARADVANFDSLTEGFVPATFTNGGITFSNLSRRIDGDPPQLAFVIENASQDLTGHAGFSPSNCLGFGGYSPGPTTAFTRLGSFDMTPSAVSTTATLEVFDFNNNPPGTTMNLEAFRNGASVGSVSVPTITTFGLHHTTLTYSGAAFDRLHFSVGPTSSDVIFAVIDTITITGSPPPPCPADHDGNGDVEPADIAAFVNVWFQSVAAGTTAGDWDHDGVVAPADIAAFVNVWFAALTNGGC